jgi:septal ring factor EnvC (AmiA/AmiB activator)
MATDQVSDLTRVIEVPRTSERRWRPWIAGTGLFLAGAAMGAMVVVASADRIDADEFRDLQARHQGAQEELAASQADLAAAESALTAAEARTQAVEGELGEWEAQADALDKRKARLDSLAEDLRQREAALTNVDADTGSVRLDPGVYLVPGEAAAGRYRSMASVADGCYVSQQRSGEVLENMVQDSGVVEFSVAPAEGTTLRIGQECGPLEYID